MSEVVLIVKHGGVSALIPARLNPDWSTLCRTICGKWGDLQNFSISCTIGKHANCVICDQGEYESMLMLSEHCAVKFVEVDINTRSPEVIALSVNVPTTTQFQFNAQESQPHSYNVDKSNNMLHNADNCVDKSGDHLAFKLSSNKSRTVVDSVYGTQSVDTPLFDMCPNLEVVPLLTDSWKDIIKGAGQVFKGGRDEFREELIKYATKSGFQYKFDKNNKEYIYVVCAEKTSLGCKWYIRGKHFSSNGRFEIRKCNLTHDCSGTIHSNKTKRLGPKILSRLVIENVRSRPTHPGTDMQTHIKLAYGLDVPYYKAWRAVDNARAVMYGTFRRSYDQLRWYCEAVIRTNEGSHAWVEWDDETKCFSQAFFAFKACLEAFKRCRPMLFVDGTFMHGRTKATILSAIAKDGNNGLVPVAFAIVNGETLVNWTWFLRQLRDLVLHDEKIFYVSDRNTGLLSAFEEVFNNEPNNFYCLYHLHNNLRSHYSGAWTTPHRDKMCNILTECAYAPNIRVFNEKVEKFIKAGGPLAKSFLDTIPPHKWAIAHAPDVMRYGEMTSNAAESFNKWILIARSLPVTFMVDTIRSDLMQWFVERRSKAEKWGSVLCEKRQDIWNYHVDLSRTWFVTKSSEFVYQVSSPVSCMVDVANRTCTCAQWQIHGFPCAHAAAVILKHCKKIEEVIEPCFLTKNYIHCYSGIINPIPDTEKFECTSYHQKATILAPPVKNNPGRPNKKGKKSYGEVPRRKKKVCPSCGLMSRHDKFTCINNGDVD